MRSSHASACIIFCICEFYENYKLQTTANSYAAGWDHILYLPHSLELLTYPVPDRKCFYARKRFISYFVVTFNKACYCHVIAQYLDTSQLSSVRT
jgi:hypothetical protein